MQTLVSAPKPIPAPAILATADIAAAPTLAPAPATPAPMILFGRDERGRPHASSFAGSEPAVVEAAARLMGLSFVAAETDVVRTLAAALPAGRLFPASGKAFVPFCSAALYARLIAATGTPDTPRPAKAASKAAEAGAGLASAVGSATGGAAAGGPAGKGGGKAPTDWPEIKAGSIVLAQADDEEGYYAAKVVATKADDHFVLVWVGYSEQPEFTRARRALALLHPDVAAKLG